MIFLILLLLLLSSTTFSATFNYSLLISSDSLTNPITLLNGTAYVDFNSDNTTCLEYRKVLPEIKVSKGEEGIISVIPEFPASCGRVYAKLTIPIVDGKITNKDCYLWAYADADHFASVVYGGTLRITELNNHFICEILL